MDGFNKSFCYTNEWLEKGTATQTWGVEVQCKGLTALAGGLWKEIQKVCFIFHLDYSKFPRTSGR